MSNLLSIIMIITGIICMTFALIGWYLDSESVENVFLLVMAFGIWTTERLMEHDNK